MTAVTWKRLFKNSDSLFAYSGRGQVGFVVPRDDGTVAWQMDGINMRYVRKGKSFGETRSVRTAKIALERNWIKWLKTFELS